MPTRRIAAARLGKMPTTLVRRLISLLSRSSGLVGADLAAMALGEGEVGQQVWVGLQVSSSATDPNGGSQAIDHVIVAARGRLARRAARRPIRMAEAIMLRAERGTRSWALRVKWTRQRCQPEPKQLLADRLDEAGVVVADDQAHAVEASFPTRPRMKRGQAEPSSLPGVQLEAQVPAALRWSPRRWPPAPPWKRRGLMLAHLEVGGVEPDVGEAHTR